LPSDNWSDGESERFYFQAVKRVAVRQESLRMALDGASGIA
jgi:hypothetical protein